MLPSVGRRQTFELIVKLLDQLDLVELDLLGGRGILIVRWRIVQIDHGDGWPRCGLLGSHLAAGKESIGRREGRAKGDT